MTQTNNAKKIISAVHDILYELRNHGYEEEYTDGIDWGDNRENINDIIQRLVSDPAKKIDTSEYRWDEEMDFNYDDGGLISFTTALVKIFHKYGFIKTEEPKKAVGLKMRSETKYHITCPHCNVRHEFLPPSFGKEMTCHVCKNIIQIPPRPESNTSEVREGFDNLGQF